MISKRKDVEEGSGVTNDDADSALTQGDTDYNPKEDEVIDGEEVDDCVVDKPVKKTRDSHQGNQRKVVFQQKTGLRSYAAHIYSKKEELKGEEISAIELFKATHHSKKFGYSVPVQEAIAEMESRKNALLPEGEPTKSDVQIVADVLKEKVKQSTFLMNAGLQSRPGNNTNNVVVAAHVRDLEKKLERSELQAKAMREEMAAIRKRAEDTEVAQAARDEELRLMTQEQNEKLAHLMALFGAKAAGT
ncbi:unnamed protein product [Alopecurus aequalis]